LGFSVTSEKTISKGGLGSVGTFGWGGAFNTQYFADPKENMIGIIHETNVQCGNEPTGWKLQTNAVYSLLE
jgi:hypothetical protein